MLDFTDHVWIEVWLPSLRRFVHVDCCERALDSPLMYESGWGKQLTYVLSFSRYGVIDATSRYTRKLTDVILRRNGTYGEVFVRDSIDESDRKLRESYEQSAQKRLINLSEEVPFAASSSLQYDTLAFGAEGFQYLTAGVDLSVKVVNQRHFLLKREIEGMSFLESSEQSLKPDELRGRISGDAEWKRTRGELGSTSDAIEAAARLANESSLK